jgi:hypothetical protein
VHSPLHPLALALAALLAGCGGDRMGMEEFRTEANAVCAQTEQRLQELGAPADSPEGVASYADRAAPILGDRHERLQELRPPEEEETAYDALVDEAGNELDALRDLRDAAEAGDAEAAGEAASRGRVATVRVNVLAVRLELRDCVRQPQ